MNKKLLVLAVIVALFGTYQSLSIWDNPTVFDSCDTIGAWTATYSAVLSIDSVDQVEGAGCLVETMGDQWTSTLKKSGLWNWAATPMMRFRIKLDAIMGLVELELMGLETEGATYSFFSISVATANEWVTVIQDLRNPYSRTRGGETVTDPIELDSVREFKLWWRGGGNNLMGHVLKLDLIELDSESGLTPLSCSITPATASITVGATQTFTCSASGGDGVYSYQWQLNGSAKTGGVTYTPETSELTVGYYSVSCTVTDNSASTPISDTSTLFVGAVSSDGEPATYTLLVDADGSGSVVPAVGSHTYNEGDVVVLIATADLDNGFLNWEVNGVNYSITEVTVTMDTNYVATAYFTGLDTTPESPIQEPSTPAISLPTSFSPFNLVYFIVAGVLAVAAFATDKKRRQ